MTALMIAQNHGDAPPAAARTYTRAEVERAFKTFAWLLVEGLDDRINLIYGNQLVVNPPSETTRDALAADYWRLLTEQKVDDPEAKLAAYERYLAGPFPGDLVPIMANPAPSLVTVREMLHDRAAIRARSLAR